MVSFKVVLTKTLCIFVFSLCWVWSFISFLKLTFFKIVNSIESYGKINETSYEVPLSMLHDGIKVTHIGCIVFWQTSSFHIVFILFKKKLVFTYNRKSNNKKNIYTYIHHNIIRNVEGLFLFLSPTSKKKTFKKQKKSSLKSTYVYIIPRSIYMHTYICVARFLNIWTHYRHRIPNQ